MTDTTPLALLKRADEILVNEDAWVKWAFCTTPENVGDYTALCELTDADVCRRCLLGALYTAAIERDVAGDLNDIEDNPPPIVATAVEELVRSIFDSSVYGHHDEYDGYGNRDIITHFNDRFPTGFEDVKAVLKETIDRMENAAEEVLQASNHQ